jgi:hypothetical protein
MVVDAEAVADLQEQARSWVRANVRVSTLEEAEELAELAARAVGEAVVEEGVGQSVDQSRGDGSSRACGCGGKARLKGLRKRGVGTVFGIVEVRRPYYYCRDCRASVYPWDEQQGLTRLLWTPRVKGLVVDFAARLPYGEATELLGRVTPVRMEESTAERVVEEVGGRVRSAEAERIEAVLDRLEDVGGDEAPDRLYVAMDGSHAHIDGSWHEVKTGTIFEAEPDELGLDRAGRQHYVSAQETAERFGERLFVAAAECGIGRAAEIVVIGDGAEWIWNQADHHYPGATQIVDYWHACEHIHDLSKELYEEGSAQGRRWARERCESLKSHGPGPLLRALKRRRPETPEQAEAINAALRYFTNHAHRMRYPEFRARGMMIGSGPVEAACKVVVGHRLKRAGMQWTARGADHILALRCLVLNRRHDLIQEHARAAA